MINTFLFLETNKVSRCYTYSLIKVGNKCSTNMYSKELKMYLFDGSLYKGAKIDPSVYIDTSLTSIYDLHVVRYENSSSWHT